MVEKDKEIITKIAKKVIPVGAKFGGQSKEEPMIGQQSKALPLSGKVTRRRQTVPDTIIPRQVQTLITPPIQEEVRSEVKPEPVPLTPVQRRETQLVSQRSTPTQQNRLRTVEEFTREQTRGLIPIGRREVSRGVESAFFVDPKGVVDGQAGFIQSFPTSGGDTKERVKLIEKREKALGERIREASKFGIHRKKGKDIGEVAGASIFEPIADLATTPFALGEGAKVSGETPLIKLGESARDLLLPAVPLSKVVGGVVQEFSERPAISLGKLLTGAVLIGGAEKALKGNLGGSPVFSVSPKKARKPKIKNIGKIKGEFGTEILGKTTDTKKGLTRIRSKQTASLKSKLDGSSIDTQFLGKSDTIVSKRLIITPDDVPITSQQQSTGVFTSRATGRPKVLDTRLGKALGFEKTGVKKVVDVVGRVDAKGQALDLDEFAKIKLGVKKPDINLVQFRQAGKADIGLGKGIKVPKTSKITIPKRLRISKPIKSDISIPSSSKTLKTISTSTTKPLDKALKSAGFGTSGDVGKQLGLSKQTRKFFNMREVDAGLIAKKQDGGLIIGEIGGVSNIDDLTVALGKRRVSSTKVGTSTVDLLDDVVLQKGVKIPRTIKRTQPKRFKLFTPSKSKVVIQSSSKRLKTISTKVKDPSSLTTSRAVKQVTPIGAIDAQSSAVSRISRELLMPETKINIRPFGFSVDTKSVRPPTQNFDFSTDVGLSSPTGLITGQPSKQLPDITGIQMRSQNRERLEKQLQERVTKKGIKQIRKSSVDNAQIIVNKNIQDIFVGQKQIQDQLNPPTTRLKPPKQQFRPPAPPQIITPITPPFVPTGGGFGAFPPLPQFGGGKILRRKKVTRKRPSGSQGQITPSVTAKLFNLRRTKDIPKGFDFTGLEIRLLPKKKKKKSKKKRR